MLRKLSLSIKKIYSSTFSSDNAESFFSHIKDLIPRIDDEYALLCDADITSDELDKAVDSLSVNKSPGSDGFTANFYKHFWGLLKDPFSLMLKEATENMTFPLTMKQGVITLIPKPDKDPKLLDNFRPITLLNTDYKIVTTVYASRLKKILHKIISDSQSGFMKGRSIHDNIRLVLDILDYRHLIDDDGFILFLDFFKAFDSIEHPFILNSLRLFGFGEKFRNIIESLYENSNSSISLSGGTSPRFSIKRGVKQGCPLSPFLFIITTELLSIFLKKSNIAPLEVCGHPVLISQLADDTTIFMKQLSEVPKILQKISFWLRIKFEKV